MCLPDFADGQDHISVEEREHLLEKIYRLLNPESIGVSHDAMDRITSPVDREKYLAAVQLTKDSAVNRSTSLLVLPTSLSPASSAVSVDTASSLKQRTKSESAHSTDNSLKLLPPPRHKRMKAAAKVQNVER